MMLLKRVFIPSILLAIFTLSCEKEDPVELPTLTTTEVTEITTNTATSGGNITDDGGSEITARGVVWGETENPTIDNNEGITIDGAGSGEFISELIELITGTKYYVKAYATNIEGTAYGNQIEFSTESLFIKGEGVTDIDGNEYETVIIGSQEWIAENLRVTRYSNGEQIRTGLNDNDWYYSLGSEGAYSIYPHFEIEGLSSEAEVVDAYGLLYNLNAVSDERGLCPTGWHVPSDEEWTELEVFLGNSGPEVGLMLRSSRTDPDPHPRWFAQENMEGNNISGFSGLPGGMRQRDYYLVGGYGYWWTSTWDDVGHGGWFRGLSFNDARIGGNTMGKEHGISVRCIRAAE